MYKYIYICMYNKMITICIYLQYVCINKMINIGKYIYGKDILVSIYMYIYVYTNTYIYIYIYVCITR